jgi:hypothetical protein
MPSGFGASNLVERPTMPYTGAEGSFSVGTSGSFDSYGGGGHNLFGEGWGGAETNDANAMQAMFASAYDSSLDPSSNDIALISTAPQEGSYHFGVRGSLSYVGNLSVEVNWYHKYFMEAYVESVGSTQSRQYMGFACYDQDGAFIGLHECAGYSHTTLSQDLENGDSYYEVTDASVFVDGGAAGTRYVLLYPPNHAKRYRPYFLGAILSHNYYSTRDTGNNRLRISSNGDTGGGGDTTWGGGFVPAGTPIGRGVHGGSYNYCLTANTLIATSWTQYDQVVNGNNYPSRGSSCLFRQGTRYIKPLTLNNYGQDANSAIYIDNWRLINLSDPGQASPGNSGTYAQYFNQIFPKNDGARLSKSGDMQCSDLNEIVIPGYGGVFSHGKGIYKPSSLKCEIDPEDATCRGSLVSDTGGGIKIASGSTSYLVDLSGNGNNFELYGNPFMGYGTLKCDGTGDHMFRNSISYSGYYTYGIWMFLPDGSTASNGKVYLAESYRASGGCWTTYSYISGGKALHQCYDNSGVGTESVQSTSQVNDGVWHYIVAVMDKDSGTLRMYFDGRLEDTEAGVFNDGNYSSLQVGGAIGCLGDTSITGHIGCFQMYDEALTDDQIYHNYNYHWESRYKWLSDTTIRNNTLKDFGSMTFT